MDTTTQSATPSVERPQRRSWTVAVVLVLVVAVIAAAAWAFAERQRADGLAAEVAALTDGTEAEGWLRADLSAFEAAYESGDYDQVRALYTDDGIITTAGNTYSMYYGLEAQEGTWDVDGAEFRRLASLHKGADFQVLGTPVAVGDNSVAFAWRWGTGIDGTALLHLRDGKIAVAVLSVSMDRFGPIE